MSRGEELWGHFYSADVDRDQGMDSREWQDYLNRNKTHTGKHQKENDKMRLELEKTLCIFNEHFLVTAVMSVSSHRGGRWGWKWKDGLCRV